MSTPEIKIPSPESTTFYHDGLSFAHPLDASLRNEALGNAAELKAERYKVILEYLDYSNVEYIDPSAGKKDDQIFCVFDDNYDAYPDDVAMLRMDSVLAVKAARERGLSDDEIRQHASSGLEEISAWTTSRDNESRQYFIKQTRELIRALGAVTSEESETKKDSHKPSRLSRFLCRNIGFM